MTDDPRALAASLATDWVGDQIWLADHAPPQPAPRRRYIAPASFSDDDVLLSIEPSAYIEALTGLHAPAGAMIRCPFHGNGEERTPSFKVYRDAEAGWFCFGACATGGSIFDFGGRLWNLPTKGSGFSDLRRQLARELLRRAA